MIGVIAVDFIKQVLFSPSVVASALIIGALLIFAVEAKNFKVQTIEATNIGFQQAIVIGLVQCLAMIPGTSRSGATIIVPLLRHISQR